MKTTIGLAIALMLGGSSALAQGGPGEKMHGPGGMPGPGPGAGAPAIRQGGPGPGAGPGPSVERRAEPRAVERRSEPRAVERRAAEGRSATRQSDEAKGKSRVEKVERSEKPAQKGEELKRTEKGEQLKRAGKQDERTKKQAEDRAQEKAKSASEGAASGDVEEKARAAKKEDLQKDQDRTKALSKAPPQSAERKEAAKHVELAPDKRDRVVTAFRQGSDVKHRTDTHINLAVGKRLPRRWGFIPVPVAVVEIVPEYRDYVFVYVDDDYVICDPESYEVVAIIPVLGGGRYAGRGDQCPSHISLSRDERDLILDSIRYGNRVDVGNLTIGWSVPRDIALEPFPDKVLSQASELSSCRYFVAEDQIAIVDPSEQKVVFLIERSS